MVGINSLMSHYHYILIYCENQLVDFTKIFENFIQEYCFLRYTQKAAGQKSTRRL